MTWRPSLGCRGYGPACDSEIGFATLERKRQLLSDASLVVMPYTEFASQSGVLHDAYSHGRPVVVTEVGALGDSVGGSHWCCCRAGNVDSLVAQIRAALEPMAWASFSSAAQLCPRGTFACSDRSASARGL